MKKILFFIAAAVVALAGCKPSTTPSEPGGDDKPQDVNKYTSIRFKETELILGVEESSKLHLLWEPVEIADAPVCEWASSDPAVATVDQNGTVIGIATGEANVTATFGELKAVCKVTVQGSEDMFAWGGMGIFKLGDEPLSDEYVLEFSSGASYKVQNYYGTFYLWSNSIEFENGVGFSGAGYVSVAEVPVAVIVEGDYAGQAITWEINFLNDYPQDSASVMPEGYMPESAEEWAQRLMDKEYENYGKYTCVPLHYWDWDVEDGSEDVDFVGYIKNGWIGDYSNGFFYQMNITWFDLSQGLYGLKMAQDDAGKWDFVEPYEYTDSETQYYEVMPQKEEAPVKPLPMLRISNQKQLERLNNSTRTLRMAK